MIFVVNIDVLSGQCGWKNSQIRITSAALATPQEIEQWLQQGILAAKAGQLEQARFQLLDVVEQDQTSEMAWYWLYQVFDRVDDKRTCLENLILINPQNTWAKQELLNVLEAAAAVQARSVKLPAKTVTSQPGRPITIKLITAFWFGISLMLLGSGIISAIEWVITQFQPGPRTAFPLLDLTLAVVFVITGILGFTVTAALFFRSMAGVYGSLFLALGLLLAGPTFSLITTPPNYTAMACIGGISGVIVLLTLASQFEPKDTSTYGSPSG